MNNIYHNALFCQKFDFQICGPVSDTLGRGFRYPAEDLSVDYNTSLQILSPTSRTLGRGIKLSAEDLDIRPGI